MATRRSFRSGMPADHPNRRLGVAFQNSNRRLNEIAARRWSESMGGPELPSPVVRAALNSDTDRPISSPSGFAFLETLPPRNLSLPRPPPCEKCLPGKSEPERKNELHRLRVPRLPPRHCAKTRESPPPTFTSGSLLPQSLRVSGVSRKDGKSSESRLCGLQMSPSLLSGKGSP